MSKFDIILVANSPGELSALVKPVAETLAEKLKDIRLILVLTPCQYTSGRELAYIHTIHGISQIITAADYKKWILLNQKPKIDFSPKGIVLYLGGDLAHAMLVAKKIGFPAFAYINDRIAWTSFYQRFFVPDQTSANKFTKCKHKVTVIGNLMVDSVANLPKWSPHKNVITFLPGSRAWQINHTTPIYKEIMAKIKKIKPDLVFQLVSSPFEGAVGIEGVKIVKFEETHNSELVITIPGTNTARLAAMGIPMLVVFPLDDPEVIPLEGLPHFIGKIPCFGSKFKRLLADRVNKQTKFFALPNIKADKEIVKEIRGIIDTDLVAKEALALLNNPGQRLAMSRNLLNALGNPGAANKIAEEINAALQETA